jgi:hypothetical protein
MQRSVPLEQAEGRLARATLSDCLCAGVIAGIVHDCSEPKR